MLYLPEELGRVGDFQPIPQSSVRYVSNLGSLPRLDPLHLRAKVWPGQMGQKANASYLNFMLILCLCYSLVSVKKSNLQKFVTVSTSHPNCWLSYKSPFMQHNFISLFSNNNYCNNTFQQIKKYGLFHNSFVYFCLLQFVAEKLS